MNSRNIQLFDKINHNFNTIIEACMQKAATAAKDYLVENYVDALNISDKDATTQFPAPVAGEKWQNLVKNGKISDEESRLYKTGKLFSDLNNIDQTWTRNGKGIKLHLDTYYSGYINEGTEKMTARPFFEISDRLAMTIKQVYEEEFRKLNT